MGMETPHPPPPEAAPKPPAAPALAESVTPPAVVPSPPEVASASPIAEVKPDTAGQAPAQPAPAKEKEVVDTTPQLANSSLPKIPGESPKPPLEPVDKPPDSKSPPLSTLQPGEQKSAAPYSDRVRKILEVTSGEHGRNFTDTEGTILWGDGTNGLLSQFLTTQATDYWSKDPDKIKTALQTSSAEPIKDQQVTDEIARRKRINEAAGQWRRLNGVLAQAEKKVEKSIGSEVENVFISQNGEAAWKALPSQRQKELIRAAIQDPSMADKGAGIRSEFYELKVDTDANGEITKETYTLLDDQGGQIVLQEITPPAVEALEELVSVGDARAAKIKPLLEALSVTGPDGNYKYRRVNTDRETTGFKFQKDRDVAK
ncbi:hypothetical protein MUP32_05740, partial [Candidatus Microgenomates bacterium]|nr:hypothetical protein [Candidatus Microgenomates bacterium]